MKNLILFVLLFSITTLFAQKKKTTPNLASWEQFEKLNEDGLYKDALNLLTPLLDQAINENNPADFQKALNKYRDIVPDALLENDEKLALLNQLENKIDQTKIPLNNIGHLFLANLYDKEYYRWRLYEEFNVEIKKISFTDRFKAIRLHYQKALNQFGDLIQYDATGLHKLYGSDSLETLSMPTLLDIYLPNIKDQFNQQNYNDSTLFYQTENLLKYPKDTLLSLYYSLENFHWKNNNHYAYVETVFDRTDVNSINPNLKKNHVYDWLFEKVKNTPAALKIILKQAGKLSEHGEMYDWKKNRIVKNKKEEAVKLLEQGCKDYTTSLYYGEAQEFIFNVKNTFLEAKIDGKILPNTSNLLSVTYKNIDSIFLTIYHIDKVINDTSKNFLKDYQLKPVHRETLRLDKNGLYNKHTKDFILPAWKQSGKFLVLISENEKTEQRLTTEDSIDSHLKFSRLIVDVHDFTVMYKSENGQAILHVHDVMDGKPIAKAKVTDIEKNNNQEKIYNYQTDKNGECTFNLIDSHSKWKVFYKNDSIENSFYVNYSSYEDEDEIHFQILTSREIYRPGQTMHYKIYAYKIKNHLKSVVKNEKLNISIKDQNHKEIYISENEFGTNDFGTYSGVFIIPKTGFPLGQLCIEVSDHEDEYGDSEYFSVEEYKRPTFYIENKFTKKAYQFEESITVKGKAITYAEYPITNATVEIKIESNYSLRNSQNSFRIDTILTTNSNGEYSFTFIAPTKTKYGFYITFNSTITNQIGETQENEIITYIGDKKKEWNVYVPQDIITSENYLLQFTLKDSVKEKTPFKYILLRQKSQNQEINQTFIEQEFQNFTQTEYNKSLPLSIYFDNQKKAKFDTISIETKYINNTISLQKITNKIPGIYNLIYYYINDQNDTISEERRIKSIDLKNVENQDNEAIWIKQHLYAPIAGQTLPILIGTNFKNQTVHYRIYRDNHLLESKTLIIDKRKTIYYTVKKEDIDGLTFEAYLITNGEVYKMNQTIYISQRSKRIKLKLESKRIYLIPGRKEKWVLTQESLSKQKKELAVTMTDASLDEITSSDWNFNNREDWSNIDYWKYGNDFYENYRILNNGNNWKNESYTFFNQGKETKSNIKIIKYYSRPLIERDAGVSSESFFIDGLKVRGALNLPKSAFESISVMNGGIPANYGDVSGGIISKSKPSTPRTNFNETAFFYPNLYADKDGKFSFEFTLPDALTTWKFRALAHDKEMNMGQLEEFFIAQKELMVQPNAPRFFRAGDTLEFSANVVNVSDKNLPVKVSLEWFNPFTNEVIPEVFGKMETQNLQLNAKQSQTVSWKLSIPENGLDLIAYRIKASSESFTDSEEKAFPILSNRVFVTEALPITIEEKGNYTFTLDKLATSTSTTKNHENLVFNYASNPIWSVVKTLPAASKVNYPSSDALFNAYFTNVLGSKVLANNPVIKQMIAHWNVGASELTNPTIANSVDLSETPWVNAAQSESEQRKEIAFFLEENNLANQQKTYLEQLFQQRNMDGAWPWFAGGPASAYITNDIVFGFAQLNERPTELDASLNYLNNYYTYEFKKHTATENNQRNWLSEQELQWLYIQAAYQLPANEFTTLLAKTLAKNWTSFSLKQQAIAGMYLVKTGDKIFATKIAASIQNRATKRKNTGTYWNEKYFSNAESIETQAYILEFFTALGQEKSVLNSIQLSLLNKKRGQLWENSSTTARVVHSLLSVPATDFSTKNNATIRIGNETITKSTNEVGELTQTWTKKEITPALGNVAIDQTAETPSFGSLTYSYTENIEHVTNSTTGLVLTKEIYLIQGEQEILVTPTTKLKVGDQLRIYLKVSSDRAIDFVHIKDLKAAGMENVNQLSNYGYGKNVSYYTTPSDNRTSFFIEHLPKGKSSVSYEVRLTHKGTQSIGYALIECLYAPEFRGNTSGMKVVVE